MAKAERDEDRAKIVRSMENVTDKCVSLGPVDLETVNMLEDITKSLRRVCQDSSKEVRQHCEQYTAKVNKEIEARFGGRLTRADVEGIFCSKMDGTKDIFRVISPKVHVDEVCFSAHAKAVHDALWQAEQLLVDTLGTRKAWWSGMTLAVLKDAFLYTLFAYAEVVTEAAGDKLPGWVRNNKHSDIETFEALERSRTAIVMYPGDDAYKEFARKTRGVKI